MVFMHFILRSLSCLPCGTIDDPEDIWIVYGGTSRGRGTKHYTSFIVVDLLTPADSTPLTDSRASKGFDINWDASSVLKSCPNFNFVCSIVLVCVVIVKYLFVNVTNSLN